MTPISGHIFLRPPSRTVWYMGLRLPEGRTMRKIGPAHRGGGRPADGTFTAGSAQRVLEAEVTRLTALAQGTNPTFATAAEDYLVYLERERGLRASTLRRYEQITRRDLLPTLGEKRLGEIDKTAILALRAHLASRPRSAQVDTREKVLEFKSAGVSNAEIASRLEMTLKGVEYHLRAQKHQDAAQETWQPSASTLNQTRTLLVGIFRHAKRARGYNGEDPSADFDFATVKHQSHIEVYSPSEVLALARAAENEQDAALFLVAGFAGLRRSELRALRWRDVDFVKSTIFVRGGYTDEGKHGPTKSGKERGVPMIPQIGGALDGLSRREHFTAPGDLVFCNSLGGELDGAGIYNRFQEAASKAGLRRLRFHDLRHACFSMMVQIFPLSDVKVYAGHSNIATTMRYVHYVPKVDAAERLGALVSADAGLAGMLTPPSGSVTFDGKTYRA